LRTHPSETSARRSTSETDRLYSEIETTDAAVTEAQDVYTARQEARESAQVVWERDESNVAEARLKAAGAEARVDALETAVAGLIDERARDLASGADGVLGSLVARLDVPEEVADAVDAALGEWRGAYVAQDESAVRSVVEVLKGAGSGGVSVVSSSPVSADQTRAIAAQFGVDAMVDMLGPKADASVASMFLGDVVVVQGWMAGWSLVSEEPSVRAVTPEGDLITRRGMFVAQPDGAGPAALEAARVGFESARRQLTETETGLHKSRLAFDGTREAERSALESLEALEATLAGLTEALGLVGRAHVASRDEAARLSNRLEALDESRTLRDERITSLRDRVAEFQGEEAARQQAWDALNDRRAEVAQLRDEARNRREAATAELASIVERRRISARRLAVIASEIAQLRFQPGQDDAVAALEAIEARSDRVTRVVASHIEALRIRQRELRESVGTANSELTSAEERREVLDTQRRTSADAVNALDIEIAELRVRDESVAEGLRRDADSDEAAALAAEMPDLATGVNMKERLASLEADLRRMGPINPLAAAEYAELGGEVDELETQLNDLSDSRAELKKVVAALDEQMVSLFEEAFAEIAGFYEENFALVFPGGSGRLRLTESDDPLNAGVLVEAQPAGKKVGRLSLLSGGERSLAALAFLFAVFRARPSPFYVLDEVEAALDDANLHRFLKLVDTLRRDVQLVIITHQQQTMHAADVLYGVTMEPGASSQVISKRMTPVTV
jgi:chromosome segregation protein